MYNGVCVECVSVCLCWLENLWHRSEWKHSDMLESTLQSQLYCFDLFLITISSSLFFSHSTRIYSMSFPKVTPQKTLSETVSQFQDTDTFSSQRIISDNHFKDHENSMNTFPPKTSCIHCTHINTDGKKW